MPDAVRDNTSGEINTSSTIPVLGFGMFSAMPVSDANASQDPTSLDERFPTTPRKPVPPEDITAPVHASKSPRFVMSIPNVFDNSSVKLSPFITGASGNDDINLHKSSTNHIINDMIEFIKIS